MAGRKDTVLQWIKFGDVDSISFIGKETVVLGYGSYVVFYDTSRPDKKEVVYHATSDVKGDGVQCLCTHRALSCFAMAEKCRNPRIFITGYPSFENMKIIDAIQETGYISLMFSEMEYLVALTGLPNYSIVMWNWRTSEKLFCRDTDIQVPKQVLRVSMMAPFQIAQAAPRERALIIWDVNMCYKKAILSQTNVVPPETSQPPYCYAWGYDGDLYFSDSAGNLFSVSSDTRACELTLGWKGDEGRCKPCLTWYKGGWAFAGPGKVQYCRRKSPEGWVRLWSVTPEMPFKFLISSAVKDVLCGWNEAHDLVLFKGETNMECLTVKKFGSNFDFVCFLHPVDDTLVTYGHLRQMFTLWNKKSGSAIGGMKWEGLGTVNDVGSNPCYPYVVVVQSTGRVAMVNMYDPTYLIVQSEVYLTRDSLDSVRFHSTGTRFCVANVEVGEFFLIKVQGDPKMEVLASSRLDLKIVDYALVEDVNNIKLLVLPMSQMCCRSGQTILVYHVSSHKKAFQQVGDVAMPTILTTAVPLTDSELLCVAHRSRSALIVNADAGKTIRQIVSGHQMKAFSVMIHGPNIITFGYDGLAIVRSREKMGVVTVVAPHHRLAKGIKKGLVDSYCQNIITLGVDGTLVSFTYSGEGTNPNLRDEYEGLIKSPQYKQLLLGPIMMAKAKERALEKMYAKQESQKADAESLEGEEDAAVVKEEKTWLEMREEERVKQDESHWRNERDDILEELEQIKKNLQELLNANLEMSENEQLPINAFDLDKANRRKRVEDAKAEREKKKYMEMATIKARDKISDYIKKLCWDSVHVKGRELHGIVSPIKVESYCMVDDSQDSKVDAFWMSQLIRMENMYRKGDYFEPWVPRSLSLLDLHINEKAHLSEETVAQTMKTKFEEDEFDERTREQEGVIKDSCHLWSGSASHNFIEVNSDHYSQFEVTSYRHGMCEITLLMSDIRNLMIWFNKQFEEVYHIKEREMASICEKNNRFRHIIKELNFFHFSRDICRTVVNDPAWSPYEQPERIMKVEDNELSVTPYLSRSQEELVKKKKVEEERLRLLLLSDDFKERALIVMMDGVLEKLWENEIKKDVPKPKCMLEKEPENYTEDDLKAIRIYEESVRFLMSERERYRKILEADWVKILNSVRDIVSRFDERLAKLHVLKMKVDSAICQETLKILRIRYKMQEKLEMSRKEENLREEIMKNEKKIESMNTELAKLMETLNDCKNYYETLQNRDRNLDKNFKKEFPDLSPIICEQLYKLSKKRPKLVQKAALFSTLLLDLGKCAVAGTKPEYLTPECIQYLKDIDGLDSNVNAPSSVSEQIWEMMCKMRRTKIECELKVRACAVDLGEAEATVSAYQKKLKTAKELQTQLNSELQALKQDRLFRDQNYDIQLVLKSGLVEIPLSGKISDFDECVLVTRDTLTEVNGIITKAGNQKIKAMQKAANFRKGIIFKEWEHKKLRMEIEDLQNQLNTIEKIKVTKELQSILVGRARGFTEERGFLYLEEEIAGAKEKFQKSQTDLYHKIDEYNMKIDKLSLKNEELDSQIAELNVDMNELSMAVDKDFDEKQLSHNMKRMKKVRYRSKLVQKIQEQHNEMLMLQTELELLRLRTFPTLKNKP